jgi:hypothetical protein
MMIIKMIAIAFGTGTRGRIDIEDGETSLEDRTECAELLARELRGSDVGDSVRWGVEPNQVWFSLQTAKAFSKVTAEMRAIDVNQVGRSLPGIVGFHLDIAADEARAELKYDGSLVEFTRLVTHDPETDPGVKA